MASSISEGGGVFENQNQGHCSRKDSFGQKIIVERNQYLNRAAPQVRPAPKELTKM